MELSPVGKKTILKHHILNLIYFWSLGMGLGGVLTCFQLQKVF